MGTFYSIIDQYIAEIEKCVSENDVENSFDLLKKILAGMKPFGFEYDAYDVVASSRENKYLIELGRMKEALISYRIEYRSIKISQRNSAAKHTSPPRSTSHIVNVNQTQSQSQHQSSNISIESIINWVKENPSLGENQTKEILDKLDEIKAISESDTKPKEKWFRLRELLEWLSKQGVEIAIKLIPLILQTIAQ